MKIRNKEQLAEHINKGNKVKYILFWGHQASPNGISKSCFSQWYESTFIVDGIEYKTAEHFMMAEKARLFGDEASATNAVNAKTPGEAKQVGRSVKNFNESIWLKDRFNIVVNANYHKFSQNEALENFLLSTKERILVEASPVDKIWGIGLAAENSACENPNLWKGLNLLGFALMEVRGLLLENKS